jgi:hypothetical protein
MPFIRSIEKNYQFGFLTPFVHGKIIQEIPIRSTYGQMAPTRSPIGSHTKPIGTLPDSQPASQVYSRPSRNLVSKSRLRAGDGNALLGIVE